MILFRRIATILSLFILGGLLELLIWKPDWYLVIIALLELVVIGMIIGLARGKIETKEISPLIITPLFFIGFSFLFLLFIEGLLYKQLIAVGIVFLWWIFIENIFLFFYQPVRYQPYALENITAYLNLVTVFLMGSSFHGLILFLGFSSAPLIIFTFLVTLLLVIQIIAINKISIKKNVLLISVLALLVSEMFWVTKFLPSSYLVNGTIIAISFYFLTGIVRHWFLESLDKKVVKRYLGISIIVLLIIAITARWT